MGKTARVERRRLLDRRQGDRRTMPTPGVPPAFERRGAQERRTQVGRREPRG